MEKKKNLPVQVLSLVGEGGFEPPKASPADLQSVPFGHSGIPPYSVVVACTDVGAGGRTRTPDLLITNQLLYRLSYTSITGILATIQPPGYISKKAAVCQPVFLFSLSWSDSALAGRCLTGAGGGTRPPLRRRPPRVAKRPRRFAKPPRVRVPFVLPKEKAPRGGFFLWCRWWDSNPHGGLAQRILSPSRLPFHHTGM